MKVKKEIKHKSVKRMLGILLWKDLLEIKKSLNISISDKQNSV